MVVDTRGRGSFLSHLFGRGIPIGLAALKERAQIGLQTGVKWLIGMGVDYLLAAALAIVALSLLVGAAVDGLAAAGLPEWAASLILAAVAGGLAFLFFQKGKKRSLDDTRRREEDVERTNVPPSRTLTVRLVREKNVSVPASGSAGRDHRPRGSGRKGGRTRKTRVTRSHRLRVTEGPDVRALRQSGSRR